jgi:hypothetical protein
MIYAETGESGLQREVQSSGSWEEYCDPFVEYLYKFVKARSP